MEIGLGEICCVIRGCRVSYLITKLFVGKMELFEKLFCFRSVIRVFVWVYVEAEFLKCLFNFCCTNSGPYSKSRMVIVGEVVRITLHWISYSSTGRSMCT